MEVVIEPGRQITNAYEIINTSEHDLYLIPKIIPFEPADQHGNIKLLSTTDYRLSTKIFSLTNSDIQFGKAFKLTANTSQQLVLKINIPADSPEKDYYQIFLIEQSPEGGFINQSGGRSLIKIGANLLLTVGNPDQIKKSPEIIEFLPQPKFADLFDSVKFRVAVHNKGQHFFKTHGEIAINHSWFNYQEKLNLLPENVLSQSSRQINCTGPTRNQNDNQNEENIENWSVENCKFSSWLPGQYQAELTISPENTEPESEIISFWLVPYKAGLGLLISGFITWEIRKQYLSS